MLELCLSHDHERHIRDHGCRAFPHECCGFLLGRDEAGRRRIDRVLSATNDRGEEEQHNRFTITPEAFMKADRAAREADLEILGFYHSHPDAPARPSEYDREHAWPVYSYVIVSVRDKVDQELTSWILADDRSTFHAQPVSIDQIQESV
ncbi:MAG: M67 family metallopeptidase [Phycisphaerae bacterium]|nr:M67 family metallopeptidase [Phycisphaerae bacterium]